MPNCGLDVQMLVRCSVLSILAVLAATGCGSKPDMSQPAVSQQPQTGGTFRMAQDSPGGLDPASVDDVYEATVVNQIFDGLVSFDTHLNTVPCIASSWVISANGMEYTFHLREGIRFHDGSPLTAEDVAYSLQRIFDLPPQRSSLAREYLCHIQGTAEYAAKRATNVSGLEVVSPLEIRITLDAPYASFLAVLASEPARVVPKHYVQRVGDEVFARQPVGSGPFRFIRWIEDKEIVLTSFLEHALVSARLDSLVFELPDHDTRDYAASRFLDGRLSAAIVPEGRLNEFRAHETARVMTRQELSLSFIGLNCRLEPFDDARVRRAFALALDHTRLIHANGGTRTRPHGILPPGMPGYTPESKLLERDVAASRVLLTEAGYPGGRGLPPIVYTTASQTEAARALIESIGEQVAEVGFVLRKESLTWLEFSRRLEERSLQCFSVTWVADIPDPDSFLYPLFHASGSANFAAYSDRRVDELLETGRRTRSSMERLAIYRQAERRILEAIPVVPLYHPLSAIAVQENVHGLQITAMGFGNMALENVWLASGTPHAARNPRPETPPQLLGKVP